MFKSVRKILCTAMCILLVLPFAGMTASAIQDESMYYIDHSVVELLRYPEDELYVPEAKGNTLRRFYSSGADEPFTFYTALNGSQKEIYNEILRQKAGLEGKTKGKVEVVFTDNKISSTKYNQVILTAKNSLLAVLSALKEDHPELFFIWGYSDFEVDTNCYTFSNFKYTLNKFSFTVVFYDKAYCGWNVVQQYYDSLLESVAAFKVSGNTRYEKVKSIHDQICKMVDYDPNLGDEAKQNPMDYDPTSVFNEPYYTVCEGYSEAFKMICDRERIPCITVVGDGGGPHKWAYVKMEDGKWYGMDVTWDDQEGHTMYDFFLSGSETKSAFFGGETFAETHKPTGAMFIVGDYTLTYPELSKASYSAALCVPDSSATFDRTNGFMFISKDSVLSEQLVGSSRYAENMPDDHTVSITGETTGATVGITNTNAGDRLYTVVRWGDINADNSVDTVDYEAIKNGLSGDEVPGVGTPNFRAADFDGDGALDAFDLYYMDMYLNGNIEK